MKINEKIEDLVRDKRTQIPTLPVVVNNILKIAGDENTSAKDLADIICKDQAIANKSLKLANSSYYGFSSEVDSITRAIAVIGFNEVIGLTIGMSVFSAFNLQGSNNALDMRGLWIHAIGCGAAAKAVSKKTGSSVTDQIFLAGLLHDMGKVILTIYFPEEYKTVLEEVKQSQAPLFRKEKEILGLDHAYLSGLLMERWNFPDSLLLPTSFHHNSTACILEYQRDAMIIEVANFLCQKAKIGNSGNTVIPNVGHTIKELGIAHSTIETLVKELKEQLSEIEAFFEVIT